MKQAVDKYYQIALKRWAASELNSSPRRDGPFFWNEIESVFVEIKHGQVSLVADFTPETVEERGTSGVYIMQFDDDDFFDLGAFLEDLSEVEIPE